MTTSTQWQLARDAAERYERILVPTILGPAAQALVEFAAPQAGEAVLDVGCGTGAAARYAAERAGPAGRVVGVDINAAMIDVAQSLPNIAGTNIDWHVNNACELAFAEAEFDVVLCAQTLQFVQERPRALAEMYRVIKPGGRIAASLWCDIRESPYFEEVGSAVKNIKPGQFVVGSFFASDNTCEICRAGYQSSCVRRVPMGEIGTQAEYARIPLADGTLVPTPDIPPGDMIPSPLAASDVLGTGWLLMGCDHMAGSNL